jgi:hypothetical protein
MGASAAVAVEFWPDEKGNPQVSCRIPRPALGCTECGIVVLLDREAHSDLECLKCEAPMSGGVANPGPGAATGAEDIAGAVLGLGVSSLAFTDGEQSLRLPDRGPALFCPRCRMVYLLPELPDSWESVKCLGCGEAMPSDAEKCPKCGWTWNEV